MFQTNLIKALIRDYEKVIKQQNSNYKATDYYYIPEQKRYDKGFIQGMISAKIWFEKHYKKVLHEQEEAENQISLRVFGANSTTEEIASMTPLEAAQALLHSGNMEYDPVLERAKQLAVEALTGRNCDDAVKYLEGK